MSVKGIDVIKDFVFEDKAMDMGPEDKDLTPRTRLIT